MEFWDGVEQPAAQATEPPAPAGPLVPVGGHQPGSGLAPNPWQVGQRQEHPPTQGSPFLGAGQAAAYVPTMIGFVKDEARETWAADDTWFSQLWNGPAGQVMPGAGQPVA